MIYKKMLYILLLSITILASENKPAITYQLSGGRFGDNIIAFIHGKWFSYKTGIPLLYKPFKYSDMLVLHKEENSVTYKSKEVKILTDINDLKEIDCLYEVPFFPENKWEYTIPKVKKHYEQLNFNTDIMKVDWSDLKFKKLIQKLIQPLEPLSYPTLPSDMISVALHVRKGGGFDGPLYNDGHRTLRKLDSYADIGQPLKFPPDSYYIEQIKKISELLNHQPIYIYLFTDHPNPKNLISLYRKHTNLPNITFDCRLFKNRHDKNVLEDYFAISKFDCLIYTQSNFSLSLSKIFDFKITIGPTNYRWHNNAIEITEVEIKTNE